MALDYRQKVDHRSALAADNDLVVVVVVDIVVVRIAVAEDIDRIDPEHQEGQLSRQCPKYSVSLFR